MTQHADCCGGGSSPASRAAQAARIFFLRLLNFLAASLAMTSFNILGWGGGGRMPDGDDEIGCS